MLRVGRDAAIVAGYRRGKGVDELARMFAVSRRTVFRVLRAARAAGQLKSQDVA